ncbi:hypothetical protein CmeUKMEL1_17470 [Cryptosporidium meleagridis]|uniref:Uncharacterized protein n=1 Tax=Cryptosporidium meleagridis TaxID=93969 RepID=A0A2P4Z5W1_9CRYT|nr:hypothetical protein CmeUKMEL1_17470 [Cryptosporidium meleagridis]
MHNNKRKHRKNKEFTNSWPLTLDHTLMESLTKNVSARETEFLEEVKLYKSRLINSNNSSTTLNSMILQYSDKFPVDSFISRLYANPHSILFLFNIIPPLLSCSSTGTPFLTKERSEILTFVIQLLFKSLIKHCQIILSIDKRLDNSLVNLSMSLTHHIQTVFSGNQDLAIMMSSCTSLLIILSNSSANYIRNIFSNFEVVSGNLSYEYDCICKMASRESIVSNNKLFQRLPFQNSLKVGNFVSYLRYLEGIANLYLLNVERPNFLTPNKKATIEKVILSISPVVLEQMEKLITIYFSQYKPEHIFGDYSLFYDGEGARLKFIDFIAPIIIQTSLKWVSAFQEISLRRFNELHTSSYFDISKFPNILEMVLLPIRRDQISDEVSDIILNFLESYSAHLSLSNKHSVPISVLSKNILISSLLLSSSMNKDSTRLTLREELSLLNTNLNWLKVLIKYFKIFSHSLVPLLLIFDLMALPLNSDLEKLEFEDPSIQNLYQEWIETCSTTFLKIVFETISKASRISKVNRATFSAPIMITCGDYHQSKDLELSVNDQSFISNNFDIADMRVGLEMDLELNLGHEIPRIIDNFGQTLAIDYRNDPDLDSGLLFLPEPLNDKAKSSFTKLSQSNVHTSTSMIPNPIQFADFNNQNIHHYQHQHQQHLMDVPDFSIQLGNESSHIFQKYRREVHYLMCCLSLITLRGSSEFILLSISAWGSLCNSLRISSSCSSYLEDLLKIANQTKFKPLEECFQKIRSQKEGVSEKLADIDEIGLVGIQRYFVWSIVQLGEFPVELYNFEDHPDSSFPKFSQKKSNHLKIRESIRDAVRNAIFFPESPNVANLGFDDNNINNNNANYRLAANSRNTIKYILPFYSFQMFLKDIYLHLNGFNLVSYAGYGQIKIKRSMLNTNNMQIKSFIVRLESILHAFSAIIKKGLTSFPLRPSATRITEKMASDDFSRRMYNNEDEIRSLLEMVSASLKIDDEDTINRELNHRELVLGNENDYFEQTRILFDAVMLKVFKVTGEFEGLMDIYLRSCHQRLADQRVIIDDGVRVYERLFRQLLCTLITLLGVSSVWFNDKSILVTLKGLKYIFRSLQLIQEDHFFPLALEQDHVGALALLKLSQNKTCFENEILDYMVAKCMDSFSRLFSDSKQQVEIPSMTFESYLILLTSLGICISHIVSDVDKDHPSFYSCTNSPKSVSATTSSSVSASNIGSNKDHLHLFKKLQKWKKYTGLVLEKYLYLLDRLIEIYNVKIVDQDFFKNLNGNAGNYSHKSKIPVTDNAICQIYNLLLVTYMLFCGLEAFFSSIFPCKYRPYSYVILTIGAEKFSHLNILEYSKRLFESESNVKSCIATKILKDASNYILGFFSREFYSRIRVILRLSCAISPSWLHVLYHPYTCIISCILQLPFLSMNSVNGEGGGSDLLLELYSYIGYDEFQFLSLNTPFGSQRGCVNVMGGHIMTSSNGNSNSSSSDGNSSINIVNNSNNSNSNSNNSSVNNNNNNNGIGIGGMIGGMTANTGVVIPNIQRGRDVGSKCNCCCNGENEGFGSNGIIKKGLHPIITLIYKLLLLNRGLNVDAISIAKLLQSNFRGLGNFNVGGNVATGGTGAGVGMETGIEVGLSGWSPSLSSSLSSTLGFVSNGGNTQKYLKEVFNMLKGDLMFCRGEGGDCHGDNNSNDNNNNAFSKVCICNYVPNIFLPLSVMMIRVPYFTLKGKQKLLDPILSFINSFKTFNVHPIIQFLSYYSVSVSTLTSINRDDYKLQDSAGYFRYFKKDSGLQDVNKLNTFCMYVNQMSNLGGNLRANNSRIDDHCCCLEYHDGVCLTLLLLLQNLTNLSVTNDNSYPGQGGGNTGLGILGGCNGVYNVNTSFIKIVGTPIRANLEVFIEYVISRCIVTLLICIGAQNCNIKRRVEKERITDYYSGSNNNMEMNLNDYNTYNESSNGGLSSIKSVFNQGGPLVDRGMIINSPGSETIQNIGINGGVSTSGTGSYSLLCGNSGGNINSSNMNMKSMNKMSFLGENVCYDTEPDQIKDELRQNEVNERFIPQKLLSNQRWVVITIKYLLGAEFTSRINKQQIERLFTSSVWGVELTTTILLAILESYCDSESFSILSDILILIRQLLNKKRFRNLLEASFCRLPIRMLIHSASISTHYPVLHFPLTNGAKMNDYLLKRDFEKNLIKSHGSNYYQKSKSSLIACTVRQFVYRLLEENFFLNSNMMDMGFSHNGNNVNGSMNIFDFNSGNFGKSFGNNEEFSHMHEDMSFGGSMNYKLPYILKSSFTSVVIKDFIQQIVSVSVSQTNKTKFRQILKEFCVKSVCKRVDE